MVDARTLISRLDALGLTVDVRGQQLAVAPQSAITDEIRLAIREAKPAILELLAPTQWNAEAAQDEVADTMRRIGSFWPSGAGVNDQTLTDLDECINDSYCREDFRGTLSALRRYEARAYQLALERRSERNHIQEHSK